MSRPLRVVAIVAAYNEEDVIGEVVRVLVTEGVQVYFIDHRSTDGTVAQVERYQGRGVIGIESFPPDGVDDDTARTFAWERILRRKEALAQELDADWFIHHDADEFRESPWNKLNLCEGIRHVDEAGYNAIDFHVLNFRPTTADPSDGDDIRERMLFYEPGEVFDRQQVKCWKKSRQPVTLATSGGHSAQFAGRWIFPIRFLLRHYPIRSQAHGARKIFEERLPRFDPGERSRGWHVQYNDVAKDSSFVRDPGSLVRYDPGAARLELFVRNREVERIERVAAVNQDLADRLTEEAIQLREKLAAKDAILASVLTSRSWKLTASLREADRLLRRFTTK